MFPDLAQTTPITVQLVLTDTIVVLYCIRSTTRYSFELPGSVLLFSPDPNPSPVPNAWWLTAGVAWSGSGARATARRTGLLVRVNGVLPDAFRPTRGVRWGRRCLSSNRNESTKYQLVQKLK